MLKTIPADSLDAVVTDPPYGIAFMGKEWDETEGPRAYQAWCERWGRRCLRRLKPGGHIAAFGGTRTYHRLAAGLEDAGFEIRDCVAWMYGSGFPKSLDVSKAIDEALGEERLDRVTSEVGSNRIFQPTVWPINKGTPVTAASSAWEGWGTALKPAFEPIVLARKPLSKMFPSEGETVAANVLEHGTGALNIDACRIDTRERDQALGAYEGSLVQFTPTRPAGTKVYPASLGRWPANVVLDEEAAAMLDGGASRFFYCAKASRAERNAGLEGFEEAFPDGRVDGQGFLVPGSHSKIRANVHPTVKPIALMRWLIRLITPPGGVVLDPFLGSGSTAIAAILEGHPCIGIEREAEYARIAAARVAHWAKTA